MQDVKNKDIMNFCLVGAGRIAQTHLEALAQIPGARLVSVVEPVEKVGRSTAENCGCRYFPDHLDSALLPGLHAVILCTPPDRHAKIASYFLDKGIHVFCEKPLTLTSAEAQDLAARAARGGLQLMMASKFRYVDDVIRAKALVETGILGRIVLYQNAFCGRVAMADRWNSDPRTSGGGVLTDNGTHAVDIARYLLGPIASVQAQAGPFVQGLAVEDTAHLTFRTRDGIVGLVDLSWSVNTHAAHYIGLYGTEGAIEVGWAGSRYRQEGSPRWTAFGQGYQKVAAFKRQIENFMGTIRGVEKPLITVEAALASVRVIEAANRSLGQDTWITVED